MRRKRVGGWIGKGWEERGYGGTKGSPITMRRKRVRGWIGKGGVWGNIVPSPKFSHAMI
jgi:hypothetical protein